MKILITSLLLTVSTLGLLADNTNPLISASTRKSCVATKFFDGDTIHVLLKGDEKATAVRLYGIDSPEKEQDYGATSEARLKELIKNKPLEIEIKGTDNHKRPLVVVFFNGNNINLQMLREGMAWHYDRYDATPEYVAAHDEAKLHKRGLWINDKAISPEDFRHKK